MLYRTGFKENTGLYTYTLTQVHIYTYIYMYIYIYTRTYIHIYVHIYIHTYTHPSIHTYIYTCMHTYMHTYKDYRHAYIHRQSNRYTSFLGYGKDAQTGIPVSRVHRVKMMMTMVMLQKPEVICMLAYYLQRAVIEG